MRFASTFASLVLFLALQPGAVDGAELSGSGLETRSERPYVHRIDLYAADGRYIDPTRPNAQVFSNDATCGKCHDVDAVSRGWHFNSSDPDVDHGRRGEPWFLIDAATGTQIPVSYRNWLGTWTPEQLGLTAHDFVLLFGRHMPGGGAGEPTHRGVVDEDIWSRTGNFEIDCMVCHSISPNYDPVRRVDQMAAGNFEYVSVVAMGLGSVRGSALDDQTSTATADPFAEFDPAREEEAVTAAVAFAYNLSRIDADKRVLFELVREIPSGNCMFCHTTHTAQSTDGLERWQRGRDVHLQSGMSCVDCHRNDIGHNIVRGYEGETPWAHAHQDAFTCRGCHMGAGSSHATEVTDAAGGLGAPIPGHRGIPLVHFDTMSCTSCHSGPTPQNQQAVIQTSMAHGLGIPRLGRRDDELPHIIQPVFLPDQSGKLAPHKMMWPSFYASQRDDDSISPILPRDVTALLHPDAAKGGGTMLRATVVSTLAALSSSGVHRPVYIANGFLHRLATSGDDLIEIRHPSAESYAWPLAHDVRPAGQSLGARGCQECHAPDSPFLFSSVRVPLSLERPTPIDLDVMDLAGLDAAHHRRFADSFAFRSLYKIAGFLALAVIALVTLGAGSAYFAFGARGRG